MTCSALTNFLISAAKQAMEYPSLIFHTLSDSQVLALVNDLLCSLDRQPAVAGNLLSRAYGTIEALLSAVKNLSRQAPLARLLAAEVVARQNQLHSSCFPNCPGEPLRSACTWYSSQLDLRLTERSGCGTVQDVCHHRQLAPTAQSVPVHGGDDWLLDLRGHERPHLDEVGAVGVGEGEVLHLFDICAGCKAISQLLERLLLSVYNRLRSLWGSQPAKALSEPVITTAPMSLSDSNLRSASLISTRRGVHKALSAFGRFNVTVRRQKRLVSSGPLEPLG